MWAKPPRTDVLGSSSWCFVCWFLVSLTRVMSPPASCVSEPGDRNGDRNVIKTHESTSIVCLGFRHGSLDYRENRERPLLLIFKLHVYFIRWHFLKRFFKQQNQRAAAPRIVICTESEARRVDSRMPGHLVKLSFSFSGSSGSNKGKSLAPGLRVKVKFTWSKATFFYPGPTSLF